MLCKEKLKNFGLPLNDADYEKIKKTLRYTNEQISELKNKDTRRLKWQKI